MRRFIGTIAMLKFSAYGDLSIASHEDEGDI